MDVAYNQHSKRNNRSSTNVNHLSLVPLTSRLPLNDVEALPEVPYSRSAHEHRTSYIEGRSAPTTPGVLSRTSSRMNVRRQVKDGLAKSKSSTHITISTENLHSKLSEHAALVKRKTAKEDLSLTSRDRNDSDWLLRAGALLSSETRESKGQSWLVSRASSTSLTGQRDEEEEALERESARNSQGPSRRESTAGYGGDDEYSPLTTRTSFAGFGGSRNDSRPGSQATSRVHSRRGSRATNLSTANPWKGPPRERQEYFDDEEEYIAEPDFVDVDEDVYDEEQAAKDEIVVKRLARNGTSGLGVWVEKIMGWQLFAVDEDGEETETEAETNEDTTDIDDTSTKKTRDKRSLKDVIEPLENEKLPPVPAEEGGWQDAAWLLSVATKVLL